MNLLNLIKEKASRFPEGYRNPGIDAVIQHLETAEKYWEKAKLEDDENLFTDVIYRTNHVFEGILKEAYVFLAGKNSSATKPYDIENYFLENKIFKERVLSAFRNYRTEWRNTATHDYKLFFSEQEALLAITSVSTFCTIVLDQIITKANESWEEQKAKQLSQKVMGSIKDYNDKNLLDKALGLLMRSYEYLNLPEGKHIKESEYLGLLAGFIKAVDPRINVESDVMIDQSTKRRADIILSLPEEKVLVEIKRASFGTSFANAITQQLLSYLQMSGIKDGILMLFNDFSKEGDAFKQVHLLGDSQTISYVRPMGAS